MVPTQGRHVMADFWGCQSSIIDDPDRMLALLKEGAIAAKATLVTCTMARTQVGVSGVVIVQESHLSIHTEAQRGIAVADFYTCGECEPEEACHVIARGIQAQEYRVMTINRGMSEVPMQSMQLVQGPQLFQCPQDEEHLHAK